MRKYIQKNKFELTMFVLGIFIGATMFSMPYIKAAFITSPPVTIGTNLRTNALAIATTTTPQSIQTNASTTYAGFFLNQTLGGNAGPVLDLRSGNLPRLFIQNTGFVGVATSSPGALFAVQGNALISGTTTVGNLIATGTVETKYVKLNGVNYTFPAADGGNTYQLATNGTGNLSWEAPPVSSPWQSLASTTITTTGSTTIGVTLTGTPKYLKIIFSATSSAGSTHPQIRFNLDAAGNYYEQNQQFDGSTRTNYQAQAATMCNLQDIVTGGDTANGYFMEMDLVNMDKTPKVGHYRNTANVNLVSSAVETMGTCYWNGTVPIRVITIISQQGTAFGWGTNLTVIGTQQ